jgi:glucan 1,3-beta-glucosidase
MNPLTGAWTRSEGEALIIIAPFSSSDHRASVNLGGWLTTEPFISPALYEKYLSSPTPAVDEWTLTDNMRKNNAIGDLEEHYKTFITEQDFAQIAAAGLNFVRIPIPYWAIEVRDGEPFLANTAWTYFLKAIQWARKYGIRINLDLVWFQNTHTHFSQLIFFQHAVPGSQNGWNHSGRLGDCNFLLGVSGLFNAQRTLEYIQVIAEFISQPQYKDVVVMFGILNEPRSTPYIGQDNLARWYIEAYNVVRNASGYGEGKGPVVSIHDGFENLDKWYPVFPNADRVALDTHPYIAFNDQNSDPAAAAGKPCDQWGNKMNNSLNNFGITAAGEFSLAINDCGKWVNGVNLGTRYEGEFPGFTNRIGDCDEWTDWTKWSPDIKDGLMQFALSSMDSLQNYFFWTWKIGNSSVSGKVESPFWSYSLGLENG